VLPVYPATQGLSHKVIRSLVNRHLDDLVPFDAERFASDLVAEDDA